MTLVRSVQLENFRGFREHTVSLDSLSVLVGQNNAGKSTFIDAVRLLAVAVRKAEGATYAPLPDWLRGYTVGAGFRTTFETVDFDFGNIHHNYNRDQPARLQLYYVNRSKVVLWLGAEPGENFVQIETLRGMASSRLEARGAGLSPILVMPPISPLTPHETQISPARVKEFMYGRLASRHFRNQLFELVPAYRRWKPMLEETWHGASVTSFEPGTGDSGREISLILREGPFASEAAWVGSGLQAWMQILWFICRAEQNAFVVLDEPDIFLHADMQRKIVKLIVARGFEQIAIATHSPEIISDVEPGAITVIRKRDRYSKKPAKKKNIQDLIDELGSRHNVQIAKLAAARKLVLYEGDDQKYISEIALLMGSEKYNKFISVPHFDIKGVDNWHQAIGAARALNASTDDQIPTYLIIDRDYRQEDELGKLSALCAKHGLRFHAWKRKEIENYFVNAAVVARIVSGKSKTILTEEAAQSLIDEAAEALGDYTIDAIADKWQLYNSKAMPSTARSEGKKIFAELRKTRSLQDIVSGKRLISELGKLTKSRFGVQLSIMALCREFRLEEWDQEVIDLTKTLAF